MASALSCLPELHYRDYIGAFAAHSTRVNCIDSSKAIEISAADKIAKTQPIAPRPPPSLSLRGQKHRDEVTPFWHVFDEMLGNAFSQEDNPLVSVERSGAR